MTTKASLTTEHVSVAKEAVVRVEDYRAELLMALDLFVRAERALYPESASYTKAFGRVPDVFGSLTHFYRIDIARANRNQLLVVAVGEGRRNALADNPQLAGDRGASIAGDRVAIDERFRVRSNFPLPSPPRDYLHVLARMVMNKIAANQFTVPDREQIELWEGVFHGFFRYEIKPVSNGGRTIMAVGLDGAVKGDVVEMQPGANVYEWVFAHRHSTWLENETYGQLDKIYLAERIYHDHVGSYSPTFKGLLPTWNELASLSLDQSPLVVQEFQLDPTFGFHAEVAERQGASAGSREPSSVRAWSVNGYGQVSEVSSIESIMTQFEQARKKVADHGDREGEVGEVLPRSAAVPSEPADRKPLLIDAVEPEK